VYEQLPVVEYAVGYEGLSMYEAFFVIEPPQVDTLITQQTPKALAQFPSAVPELEHSVEVMQTPFKPAVETAAHASFLKVTMLNKENCLESFAVAISFAEERTNKQTRNDIFSIIFLLAETSNRNFGNEMVQAPSVFVA
jgi:hypothetical protein